MIAGAAPPQAVIEGMERIGFDLTHVYGLTEVYGPARFAPNIRSGTRCRPKARAEMNGRQGVRYEMQEGMDVFDPQTMQPVPRDGETMGEIFFRGNITMKGYLKNPIATAGGVRRRLVPHRRPGGGPSGRLCQDQGPLQGHHHLRRREHLHHRSRGCALPASGVLEAAVVARPDEKWGETPCAFVTLEVRRAGA